MWFLHQHTPTYESEYEQDIRIEREEQTKSWNDNNRNALDHQTNGNCLSVYHSNVFLFKTNEPQNDDKYFPRMCHEWFYFAHTDIKSFFLAIIYLNAVRSLINYVVVVVRSFSSLSLLFVRLVYITMLSLF